ncbi:MAG: glycosyltransferase [Pseudomonadota bacterium]
MTELTVLIATHNGASVLPRTLEGYAALGAQPFAWKLVVIDNGSTDETQAVLASFKDRLPLEILAEEKPGKNAALNRGLTACEGAFVILSDDDSIPHPGFLAAWKKALEAYPDTRVFGGAIEPLFDAEPEEWMGEARPHYEELYADRTAVPAGPIGADWIFGPNMALRISVFDAGFRFDEGVGPNATKTAYAMGSETAFLHQLEAAGYKFIFAPGPRVSHIVRAHQITPDYISGRAYRMGRGTAHKHLQSGSLVLNERPAIISLAGKLLRAGKSLPLQVARLTGSPRRRFDARWDLAFQRGYRDELQSRKKSMNNKDLV